MTKDETVELNEGNISFQVPKRSLQDVKGPYRARGTGVFYNPQMEPTRDLTIAVVEKFFLENDFKDKSLKFLDGLAGSGIRGLRLAQELRLKHEYQIILNDGNPDAVELINDNIHVNDLEDRTKTMNENLNTVLCSQKFHFVDIDPFGTAVQFIDNAVRAVRPGGLLAVTSTDTAPLCGTYPKTCQRRYGAMPKKNEYMHETGLRILMGYIAKTAAKYDLSAIPVFNYYMDYYFRTFFKIEKGATSANEMLKNVGYVIHDDKSGVRFVSDEQLSTPVFQSIGPLWTGNFIDCDLINKIDNRGESFASKTRFKKLCGYLSEENNMPPWFYDINRLASKLGDQPKKFKDIKERLENIGLSVAPTHFSPQGFKTNAAMEEMRVNLGCF
jgi:tRNA (guanine26-N2/guanine27-N2)-dimethyltransferase